MECDGMGSIRHLATGEVQLLQPEHLVGRAASANLRLTVRYVSAQHALIRWAAGRWEIKDLGSRNGTFLDDVRVQAGAEVQLRLGCRLSFGKREQAWELVSEAPPQVMAVPLDGGEPALEDGELVALPSSQNPVATIYQDAEGGWVLEQPEQIAPISNLQVFDVGGRSWRFCCPENHWRTSLADPTSELETRNLLLRFSVSRDEEHVHLEAVGGSRTFDLGSRAHNYLLLTLARKRLADAAEGVPETSCGWVYQEDLAHDPSMAPPQLNIDVFRLRQQFAKLGLADAATIVERRPRTRQLRIGVSQIAVTIL
jgi:hypothetical protein